MGSVVVQMSVSLDGFMSGPDGELDWHLVDEELHQHFNDVLRGAGAFLDGRVNHELMSAYWPTADQDPAASAPEREFAGIFRETPKVVFSRTLPEAPPGTELVREVVPEVERARAAAATGPLFVGGALLAASFAEHDLVDEYRIYVHPVLIGRGRPLFPAADRRTSLQLLESRSFGNGVVLLRYGRS